MKLLDWILSPDPKATEDEAKGFVIDSLRWNANDLTLKGFGLWCRNRLGRFMYLGPIRGNANNGVTLLDTGGEGIIFNLATMRFWMDFHANMPSVGHMEQGDILADGFKNLHINYRDQENNNYNLIDIETTKRARPYLNWHGDIHAQGLSIDGDSSVAGNVCVSGFIFQGETIGVVDGVLKVVN